MRTGDQRGTVIPGFECKELSPSTWSDFEDLFQRHGGVWGGCWCMYFHVTGPWAKRSYEQNKREKKALVNQGKAHGIMVYHEGKPVGWCQFGPREELPRVEKVMKGYEPTSKGDFWRITCFFVDRTYRRRGIARTALQAALEVMKSRGVKIVEAYPLRTRGKRYSPSWLFSGTSELFEQVGFKKVADLGTSRVVVQKRL